MSLDSTFVPHDVLRVATYNIHKGVSRELFGLRRGPAS